MHIKRNCAVLGLTLLLTALPVLGQQTSEAGSRALLKAIPADAWGFVAIRSLEGLNKDILGLAQKLQLPIGEGGLIESPLAAFKAQFGIDAGFDDKGSLAVVVLASQTLDEVSKQIVILVPSKDIKALTGPLQGKDAGDKLMTANLFQQQVVVGAKGGFAVVAPVEAAAPQLGGGDGAPTTTQEANKKAIEQAKKVVQSVIAAKGDITAKIDKASLADIEKNDLYLWANLDPIITLAKPMLEGLLAMLQTMGGPGDQAQMQFGFGKLLEYADQAATLGIGIDLSNGGLGINGLVSAKPDTELAKIISGAKGTDKSLLVGLPVENFVIAGGQRIDPTQAEMGTQNLTQLIDMLLAKDEVKEAVVAEKATAFKSKVVELSKTGGTLMSFALSALPAGPAGRIGATLVIEGADSSKTQPLVGEIIAAAKDMVADEEWKEALGVIEYKAEAEKIGDVRVDHVVLKLEEVAEVSPEDIALVKKLVGEEGVLIRVIAASPKHVAIVFGGGEERAQEVIKICKSGGAPLGEGAGIKRVSTQMPKQHNFEFYMAIDAGLDLVKTIAREVGEDEIAIMMPKIDAPLAVVGSGGPGYGRIDLFIPVELLQAGTQAFMQGMMMGGM